MLILEFWRGTRCLNIFCVFLIIVFFCTLNISCSSGKKEIRSEQTNTASTLLLSTTQEKTATKDSILSPAPLNYASTVNDTVIGVLYVTGNEPFTTLMLSVSLGVQYHVEADSSLESKLWQLQGKRIGVVGIKKSNPTGIRIDVSSFHTIP